MAKPDWGVLQQRFLSELQTPLNGITYPKRVNRNRRKANCWPAVVQQRAMLEVTMSLQVSQKPHNSVRDGISKQNLKSSNHHRAHSRSAPDGECYPKIRFHQPSLGANVDFLNSLGEALMRFLIQTFLTRTNDGRQLKYEIYSSNRKLDHFDKVPEGSCRVICYQLSDKSIQIINDDVDVTPLFEANQPKPNTWYSDGPDRVRLDMLIDYLRDNS